MIRRDRAAFAFLLGLLALVVTAPAPAQDARPALVLNSDTVWPAGKPAAVTVSGPRGAEVWLALYRIDKPEEFLVRRPPPGATFLALDDAPLRAALDAAVRAAADPARAPIPECERTIVDVPPWAALVLLESRAFTLAGGTERIDRREPLGTLDPGAYLVEAGLGDEVAHALLLVSDLTLLTRRAPDELLVYTVERTKGDPVSGARVVLAADGAIVREATTDAAGLARFAVADLDACVRVVGARDGNFCVADTDSHARGDEPVAAVLGWAESPVAAAGTELGFAGVAVGGGELQVEARDAAGKALGATRVKSSARGAFRGTLALPADAGPGIAVLTFATADGAPPVRAEFRIARATASSARLELYPPPAPVLGGERASVRVFAVQAGGNGLPGAEVVYSVSRGPCAADERAFEHVLEERMKVGADGSGEIVLPTRTATAREVYRVRATIADPERGEPVRAEARVETMPARFTLQLEPARRFVHAGDSAHLTVTAADHAGRPVQTPVAIEAETGGVWCPLPGFEGQTGPSGRIVFEAPLASTGRLRLRAFGRDASGRGAADEAEIWVLPAGDEIAGADGGIEIVPERATWIAGEAARFLLVLPVAGAHVLLTAETKGVLWSELLHVTGNHAVAQVPVTEKMTPNFYLRATLCRDNALRTFCRSVAVQPVERRLVVEATPDLEAYRPGGDAGLTVRVRDVHGLPAPAELLFTVLEAKAPDPRPSADEYFHPRRHDDVEPGSAMGMNVLGVGRPDARLAGRRKEFPATAAPDGPAAPAIRKADGEDLTTPSAMAWAGGPVATDEGGVARVRFTLPERFADWRARVVAVGADAAVGEASAELRVEGAISLDLAAPPFLREGDQALATLRVCHHGEARGAVEIRLRAEPGIVILFGDAPVDRQALDRSGRRRTATFAPGEARVFPVRLLARGCGSCRIFAEAAEPAGEARQEAIVAVIPFAERKVVVSGELTGGMKSLALSLPEGADPAKSRIVVHLGVGPAGVTADALDRLPGDPEGTCEGVLEQFVPHALGMRALGWFGVPHPRLARELPGRIRAGLDTLREMQNGDGGWGWRKGDPSDPEHTAMVVLSLSELRERGVTVPKDLWDRASGVLFRALQAQLPNSIRWRCAQAYSSIGGTLSMVDLRERNGSSSGTLALLERMERLAVGRWGMKGILGSDHDFEQDGEAIQSMIARLGDPAKDEIDLGELVECAAAELESAGGAESEPIRSAATWLLGQVEGGIESGRRLMRAIAALSRSPTAPMGGDPWALNVRINGEPFPKIEVTESNLLGPDFTLRSTPVNAGKNYVVLSSSGSAPWPTYYRAELLYSPPPQDLPAASGDPAVRRSWFRLAVGEEHEGRSWTRIPLDGLARLGDTLLVRIEIDAQSAGAQMVMKDDLPPGFQGVEPGDPSTALGVAALPEGARLAFTSAGAEVTMLDLPKGATAVEYAFRPGFAGEFRLPPVQVHATGARVLDGRSTAAVLRVE